MTRERVKFGIPELDASLGGGIPYGSDVLLKNIVGTPKEAFLRSYVLQGAKEGNYCWILSTTGYGEDMFTRDELGLLKDEGKVIFIDGFSNPYDTKDVRPHSKHNVKKIIDMHHIQKTIREATLGMEERHSRGVINSFTPILKAAETYTSKNRMEFPGYLISEALRNIHIQKAILRDAEASLIYTANPKAHTTEMMSFMEDLVDCVISLGRVKTNGELKNTLTVEKLNRSDFDSTEQFFTVKNREIEFEKR